MSYCQTLRQATQGEYQEKGSRFLAYAMPCADESAFAEFLAEQKAGHPKARHHCYAWRFGEYGQTYRAYDDGEPSGTAGLPIYNQLQSENLSDVAVIVVRYFGGTLLGTSGLIRAYKKATQAALAEAAFQPIVPQVVFSVQLEYAQVNRLMQWVEKYQIEILAQKMEMLCEYRLCAARDDYAEIEQALRSDGIVVLANP